MNNLIKLSKPVRGVRYKTCQTCGHSWRASSDFIQVGHPKVRVIQKGNCYRYEYEEEPKEEKK